MTSLSIKPSLKLCYLNLVLSLSSHKLHNRLKYQDDDEHVPEKEKKENRRKTTRHKRQENLLTIKLKRGLREIK